MGDFENQSMWDHASKNIIGLVICGSIFAAGFLIHGNTGVYLNLSGFVIVLGGTLSATFLSFRVERLIILAKVLKASYTKPLRNPDDMVEMMVDLSVKKKLRGILSLQMDEEETTILFLRQAVGFLVDGCSMEQIREFLNAEMYFFKMRREETCRVLQAMAEIAPAFGVVGSVVGLVGMLSGMGSSTVIMSTIPVALTSTLYGIVLSNFFLYPFIANIRERTVQELFLQKIISEGMTAIAGDIHPRMVERKLKAYLTPSARKDDLISLAKIREQLEKKVADPPADLRDELKN